MGKLSEGLVNGVKNNPILTDTSTGKQSGLMQVGNAFLNSAVSKLGSKIGDKIYGRKTSGALDYLDENVVTYAAAYNGFSDIIDELQDPWRPRLVWLYFEDHVYIGHFQSFNYTRSAESVNIHYEMSFVIQREVIITSYKPTLPGFLPAIKYFWLKFIILIY